MKKTSFQDLINELSSPRLMAGDPTILLIILAIPLVIVIGIISSIVWLVENYPRFTIPPLVSTVVATVLSWMFTGEVNVIIKFSLGGGIIGAIIGAVLEIIGDNY
ncbi:hypothetical protein WJM97_10910 [Okeanomitos corallinicola TIOX110]|uniref:Uncharacterized protein n=1 Tax=Okeanomitos corallinicola TIOX110 TaxID=3133117 RepID=A0ABZ2UXM0_9CYAN